MKRNPHSIENVFMWYIYIINISFINEEKGRGV